MSLRRSLEGALYPQVRRTQSSILPAPAMRKTYLRCRQQSPRPSPVPASSRPAARTLSRTRPGTPSVFHSRQAGRTASNSIRPTSSFTFISAASARSIPCGLSGPRAPSTLLAARAVPLGTPRPPCSAEPFCRRMAIFSGKSIIRSSSISPMLRTTTTRNKRLPLET